MEDKDSSDVRTRSIPVIAEEATVLKKAVDLGRVRVTKQVQTDEQLVSQTLRYEEAQIDRVTCGTPVDPASLPQIRQEGDLTIVPVVEEVLVVEKRLVLKEEIHIRRVVREESHEIPVSLKHEEVSIERTPSVPTDPSS